MSQHFRIGETREERFCVLRCPRACRTTVELVRLFPEKYIFGQYQGGISKEFTAISGRTMARELERECVADFQMNM